MPTVNELIAAAQTKFDATTALIVTLRKDIATRQGQLENAEAKRALLKTRLEALQALAQETP